MMDFGFRNIGRINTGFGQPIGAVCQIGYVVEDVEDAIRRFHRMMGVGPWFLLSDFRVREHSYRGQPTGIGLSIAASYCGNTMIELIMQKDDGPSVYRDVIADRGYGVHHYAVVVEDLDVEEARLAGMGVDMPYRATTTEIMGDMRVIYADTRREIGVMLEMCEYNPVMDGFFTQMKSTAEDWDGQGLIIRV
ncbi:hypothetical protein EIK56_01720 [Sphingomonas sp. C8-2]|jgi:hypothetical protein|nr:hypothetical protein EIK56_01720 [Sphingomonas sp. C8-2]